MALFSVLLLTAPPPSQEPGGAFVKVDGREALLRSVELFLNRENVKQIQLAFLPEDMEQAKQKYGGHLGFSGVKVVSGGPRWIDQIAAGVEKLSAEATHVIVHDAARPAVAYTDVEALMEAAEGAAVAALVTPCRSGLIDVDEGGNALAYHSARQFVQVLTPQCFSRAKFLEMAAAKQEPHASQLTLVNGSPLNLRIGSARDASLVRAMIGLLPKPKAKPLSSPFEEAQW